MRNRICVTLFAVSAILCSCGNEIDFDACGQIDAVQVTVSAECNGKILSFDLEEGDEITAGQYLGAIDSVQTALAVQELKQRILGAESKLVDIELQGKPNREQLQSLEKDLERYTALLQNNAATQKQVDDLKDKISILKSQISAQDQSWKRGNAGILSEIKTYEIQLAQKEDQLLKSRIVAPVSGTVLTKYAEAGENVTTGKPLYKVADLNNTYVRAYFTTNQLADLKLGDELRVMPDDGSASPKEYKGKLVWISQQAEFTPKNIQTRDERADMVYEAKILVPNDGYLRLGMYAYVKK